MAGYTSKHAYVLIGQEVTYGTGVAVTKDLGMIQSVDFKDSREITSAYSVSSRIAQQLVEGKWSFTGDIELYLQHGRPFEYIFGSVSHANSGADYKHTFTVGTTLPSFTMEDGYNSTADVVNTYKGVKVNEATISLEKEGVLTCKLSLISKNNTVSSSATSAVVDDLPVFRGLQGSCLIGTAGAEASWVYVLNGKYQSRIISLVKLVWLQPSNKQWKTILSVILVSRFCLKTQQSINNFWAVLQLLRI